MRPTIALYQPDIAGNTGTILRLGACLGLDVAIIEPAGFDMSDRALKRAGMDYVEMARLTRHLSFAAFEAWRTGAGRRLVLFTTAADTGYTAFAYRPDDVLLFGRGERRRAGGGARSGRRKGDDRYGRGRPLAQPRRRRRHGGRRSPAPDRRLLAVPAPALLPTRSLPH